MIKIAIVDDEEEQVASIREVISDYGKMRNICFSIDYYKSAFAIDNKDADYDIIFLDVQMPGIDGMKYANEIRQRNNKVVICFITSFAQYAVKGYEVNAVDYILKPIAKSEFLAKFPRILRYVDTQEEKVIKVKATKSIRLLNTKDIIYVASFGHTLCYYLTSGEEIESRYSLKELEKELMVEDGFIRCNSSYLVNIHNVRSIKGNDVEMSNSHLLAISQSKRKNFLLALSKV